MLNDQHFVLSIDKTALSARTLSGALRAVELLVALRSMSPKGRLLATWPVLYRSFVVASLARRSDGRGQGGGLVSWMRLIIGPDHPDSQDSTWLKGLDGAMGADAEVFEEWTAAEFADLSLLPIEDIRTGSYEFVLQVANLAVIFGLQDYSMLKDVIQWTCERVKELVKSNDTGEQLIKSGEAGIRLSPEMVRALRHFDEVSISEAVQGDKRVLKIKLLKSQSDE